MRVAGLCACAVLSANLSGQQAMHETAIPAVRPAGAPEYADVSMRYGWVRSSFPTVDDAQAAIRDFHATRVDWFYPGSHVADMDANYVTKAEMKRTPMFLTKDL
jgi:hypothetical protein